MEATESRQLSRELSDAASSLTDKLSETKERLGEKEGVAASDGASALTALEKANQAQNKARDASRKVNEAKKELDDIAAILLTVQEPGNQNMITKQCFLWYNVLYTVENFQNIPSSIYCRAWFTRRISKACRSCRG